MKLIFLDVDGTIIPFGERNVPESSVKAISLARKMGNKVFLNTGRCRCEVQKELEDVGFDGIICSNSLYIEENKKILFQKDILPEDVKRLSDWLLAENTGFFFEGQKSVKATKLYFEQMTEKFGEESIRWLKKGFPVIKEGQLLYDDVGKINFITHPGLYEKIKGRFGNDFQHLAPHDEFQLREEQTDELQRVFVGSPKVLVVDVVERKEFLHHSISIALDTGRSPW